MSASEPTEEQQSKEPVPPLEWMAAVSGLVFLVSTVTFLISHAVAERKLTPRLTAAMGAVQKVPGGFHASVEVRNESDATVASLQLEGELVVQGKPPERSEATFDFVPGRSTRSGGLFFNDDPRTGELRLRPLGYQDP